MAGYMYAIVHLRPTHRLTAREVFIYDPIDFAIDSAPFIPLSHYNYQFKNQDATPLCFTYKHITTVLPFFAMMGIHNSLID